MSKYLRVEKNADALVVHFFVKEFTQTLRLGAWERNSMRWRIVPTA